MRKRKCNRCERVKMISGMLLNIIRTCRNIRELRSLCITLLKFIVTTVPYEKEWIESVQRAFLYCCTFMDEEREVLGWKEWSGSAISGLCVLSHGHKNK